jgi:dipeptidase E
MGMQVDSLDLSSTSADVIAATLEKNDFIYVSGGNTFYLLQELKRTAADVEIIKQVNLGKMYIGESAGAMITSANIEYVKDMDDCVAANDLLSYEALNLIDFFPIPHYKNEPFQNITAAMVAKYSDHLNIKPFSNHEAFHVQDDQVTSY